MEFKFSKEEEDIRRAAHDFAQKELAEDEIEELDHVSMDTMELMGSLDFLGIKVSEEYGGMQAGWVELGVVLEEIAKGSTSISHLIMTSTEAGMILDAHGSEEVKREWLESTRTKSSKKSPLVFGNTSPVPIQVGFFQVLLNRFQPLQFQIFKVQPNRWQPLAIPPILTDWYDEISGQSQDQSTLEP